MGENTGLYLGVVLLYVTGLIAVAIWKSRKVKDQADFMVAGRSVPTILLVGTLVCTWIGSGSLFAGAGLAFRKGFSELWMSAGAWLGIAVVFFLAARVRRIADYSVPQLLERRYNSAARLLGTLVIVLAYLSIASYQFRGGGNLLNLVIPVDATIKEWIGIDHGGRILVAAVIMCFTALAGMVSVVSVDVFNGLLMILGVGLGIVLMLGKVGGFDGMSADLPPTHFELFGTDGPVWAFGIFFPTFFLLLGESGMYQKFLSARNARAARRAALGMIVGVILIESAICLLAILGASAYQGQAPFFDGSGGEPQGTENIIIQIARHDLPPVAGCLLLAGGLAIVFSTANTFLMVPALNLGHDVFKRFLFKGASEKTVINFQRLMIFVLGITGLFLVNQFPNILSMAFASYNMVGAGLTPALLAVFLWKRVTPAGAVASIATGMVAIIICTGIMMHMEAGGEMPEIFTTLKFHKSDYHVYHGVIPSVIVLITVSLLTKPSPEAVWKPFWSKVNLDEATQDASSSS